jgi:uncharacterized membrane protein
VITAASYQWLLVGHILAAMVWLGGGVLLTVMAAAALHGHDAQGVARFVAGVRTIGHAVLAPGTPITLGLGVWLVADSAAWDVGQAWVLLALALITVAIAVGATSNGSVTIVDAPHPRRSRPFTCRSLPTTSARTRPALVRAATNKPARWKRPFASSRRCRTAGIR